MTVRHVIPALLIQLCAAAAAYALGASAEVTLVVVVLGAAAVMITAGGGAEQVRPLGGEAPVPPRPRDAFSPALALLDMVSDPLLVLEETRVVSANAEARRVLGAGIVGQQLRVAIRSPEATELLADAEDSEAVGEVTGLGGTERRWEMRISRVEAGRRVVQLTDRTASQAAARMRTDFVANASHELRTPLAAVIGYAETLLDDDAGGDAPTRKRFLEVIAKEAARLQRLVSDLLSLSRIEADRHRAPDDSVDLAAVFAEVVGVIRLDHAARLKVDSREVPPVAGDRGELSQLLHNIIGNALQYGRPGTEVTVTLSALANEVVFQVADEGDGIAPEHLPRLTERFYRVDAGRSRSLGGTGLGLAIVKHIVERHRGQLEIRSTVGRGTTVIVRLPALGNGGGPHVTKA